MNFLLRVLHTVARLLDKNSTFYHTIR